LDSYLRGLNAKSSQLDNSGGNISIGIVDSLRGPESSDNLDIQDGVDYYNTKPRDPLNHGTNIFNLISHYLPDAEFRCYRVIGGEKRCDRTHDNLLKAITKAKDDGVDLLNVSAGYDLPADSRAPTSSELQNLVRRGPSIVSSAGNFLKEKVTDVTQPAASESVVAVGGYEPLCQCDPQLTSDDGKKVRYSFGRKPVSELPSSENIYCAYSAQDSGGCSASMHCSLDERLWEGNVSRNDKLDKPDVYCPVRYPAQKSGNIQRKIGTSYAAPIITSVIAKVLHAIQDTRDPSGEEIRRKVKSTGVPISSGPHKKIDAEKLMSTLRVDQTQNPFT